MFAKKVIEQAKAWLGKKESDGSHKEIIDVYNSHKPLARGYAVKYTDSWCATFVSAVAIKLGYTSIIPTECSCERMIELFKNLGCWVEDESRTPEPGEIIFYDWQDSGNGDNKGWADHVGIVETVSGSMITVIEGNYSNEVKRRTLAVNGKTIRGYGVPKYDAEPVQQVNATPTTSTQTDSYSKTQFIKDVQAATGAKVDGIAGSETLSKTVTISKSKNTRHPVVQYVQKYLNAIGFDCGKVDGIAGNKFDAAMKAFQGANGCVVDGEATKGKKTWKKLLGLS